MNTSPLLETTQNEQSRRVLRKKRRSMLDPYTLELLQMERDKKTIPEMLDWLDKQGITTSHTNVSQFLQIRREERAIEVMTQKFDSRAKKWAAVRQWLGKHPQPDLGTVIEVLKMLVMDLATEEETDPGLLALADRLSQTAIRFVNAQGREAYRMRKLVMEEAKHAEWVKCEQARGFEFCLAESKKYPAVADMYRAAFDALEKCRKENGDI